MKTAATLLEPPPRTVRPRKRVYKHYPIVAIDGDRMVDEGGTVTSTSTLIDDLRTRPSTLFAKHGAADFLSELDAIFSVDKNWQWRVSTHERDIVRPDGLRVAARISVVVHYFGWKGGNFHKIIDPVIMYGRSLNSIWPIDDDLLTKLMRWAIAVRDFCDENGMDVRPTSGGIGAQFLTDPRFYPERRRKVPAATNAQARDQLPGNHYHLAVAASPNREFAAYYLDQRRAHHYHARTTTLPDSNHLYAYGRFLDLAKCVFERTWPDFYGLYCVDLKYTKPSNCLFHWLGRKHLTQQFVYSNELSHLRDMGFEVTGVRAAWGSRKRDIGIPLYAAWCDEQLDRYDDAPWLKPLLLSAYGVLATRAKQAEAIFHLAKRGEPVTVRTGHGKLSGLHTQASRKLEPGITNVIHRGMIEAATRSDSVGLAQWLWNQNHQVLSIYADAVLVRDDDDKELPSLPEPWRNKQTLTHLRFINQQAFVSGEMTKLPGVGRELLKYRQAKPGYAPRKQVYDVLKGNIITTRRI